MSLRRRGDGGAMVVLLARAVSSLDGVGVLARASLTSHLVWGSGFGGSE